MRHFVEKGREKEEKDIRVSEKEKKRVRKFWKGDEGKEYKKK